jgi:hypothetical protein
MMNDRYTHRPLIMLLDKYVLWSIGELSDEEEVKLQKIAPYIQKTFNFSGTWQEVIAQMMEFPAHLPADLHALWLRNLEIARTHNDNLTPQRFAEMIVDENFSDGLRNPP